MICPNCNSNMKDDMKFCPNCGNEVAENYSDFQNNISANTSDKYASLSLRFGKLSLISSLLSFAPLFINYFFVVSLKNLSSFVLIFGSILALIFAGCSFFCNSKCKKFNISQNITLSKKGTKYSIAALVLQALRLIYVIIAFFYIAFYILLL